jgi:hypothetical protein
MPGRRVSIPLAILLLLTCGSIAFFIFYGQDFPPTMVLHLGIAGPDRQIDRVKFIVLGSFLALMLPTFITTVVGVLPRVLLARGRPEARFDTLLWFALWLGCAVQVVLLVANIAIYRANLR